MRLRKAIKGCALSLPAKSHNDTIKEEIAGVVEIIETIQGNRDRFESVTSRHLPDHLLAFVLELLAGQDEVRGAASHRLVCRLWRWLCDDAAVLTATVAAWKHRHTEYPTALLGTAKQELQAWSETFPEVQEEGEEDSSGSYMLALRVVAPLRRLAQRVRPLCNMSDTLRVPRPLAEATLRILKKQNLAEKQKPQQALSSLCKQDQQQPLEQKVIFLSLPLPLPLSLTLS